MKTTVYTYDQSSSEGFIKGRLYINKLTDSIVLCMTTTKSLEGVMTTTKSLEGVLIHVAPGTTNHIGDCSGWISESFEPFTGRITLTEEW